MRRVLPVGRSLGPEITLDAELRGRDGLKRVPSKQRYRVRPILP